MLGPKNVIIALLVAALATAISFTAVARTDLWHTHGADGGPIWASPPSEQAPTEVPTATPEPTPAPGAIITAHVSKCEFIEAHVWRHSGITVDPNGARNHVNEEMRTYFAAAARFYAEPVNFGEDDYWYELAGVSRPYSVTYWLEVADQDGNVLWLGEGGAYWTVGRYVGFVLSGTGIVSTDHRTTYDYRPGFGTLWLYNDDFRVDDSVTSITCRAWGEFDEPKTVQPDATQER